MSIWVSADPEVRALDGHDEAANYRAEGTPSITIDLATTSYHDHVRLALWDDNGLDVCALLSPAAARRLSQMLAETSPRGTFLRKEGQ